MAVSLTKAAAAAAVMGGVLAYVSGRLGPVWAAGNRPEQAGALGLCVGVGLVVYGLMVLLLRVDEVRLILGMVRQGRGQDAGV